MHFTWGTLIGFTRVLDMVLSKERRTISDHIRNAECAIGVVRNKILRWRFGTLEGSRGRKFPVGPRGEALVEI